MRVLITGGAGFIGKKLAARLLERGRLLDQPVDQVTLFDVAPAEGLPDDPRLQLRAGDITRPGVLLDLLRPGYDAVYHLAAVVSGAAEADIDLGYAVNLDGTRHLLDAVRAFGAKPRLVFASSCAVFGGELPEIVQDDTPLTPQTSYGGQKAMGELLVADFHRKGFLDGRSLRLPTICVRPGKPNKAASTWASSIFREPLAGQPAVCPVTATPPCTSSRRAASSTRWCMRWSCRARRWAPPATSTCPAAPSPWPRWWPRSSASPAARSPPASAGSRTR